jgi:sodium-dependent dicarboxylate transporter 2/3/5
MHDFAEEKLSEVEEKFEALRRKSGFFLAPVGFALTWWWTSSFLSPEASKLSAVMVLMVLFWITESIPLPVTALLGAVLNIVLGVADTKTVLAPFADPIIFLFIGGFMLSRAMLAHGLDRRIALAVLSIPGVGKSPARILLAIGLVTAPVSMWVSNTATTAIFLPIAMGVLGSMLGSVPLRGQSFATGVMLMLAYGASLGGIMTPVGSPPNLIAIGQLEKLARIEIGFLTWMIICVPIFLVMFFLLWGVLYFFHPAGPEISLRTGNLSSYIAQKRSALGSWTRGEISTALAFTVAVILWLVPGFGQLFFGGGNEWVRLFSRHFPEAIVALLAASLLFFLPGKKGERALSWEEAAKIDWGIILLFGGGLSLGSLMFSTGVAETMGEAAAGVLGPDVGIWGLTALAIGAGIILSETTSNTSSATMLCPVVIALAAAMGVNPVAPTIGACLGASMGFMLPVSTPPNAIVYGSGLVPLPAMLRAGIFIDIIGFIAIWLGLRVMCPLLGLV